ncbi:hypothetical protein C8Q70DRAFT_243687 [Cubamyces menziesii]|nr:hypothetical protein C8Q70DRAFT_243687 [Cubamyces menziesii]
MHHRATLPSRFALRSSQAPRRHGGHTLACTLARLPTHQRPSSPGPRDIAPASLPRKLSYPSLKSGMLIKPEAQREPISGVVVREICAQPSGALFPTRRRTCRAQRRRAGGGYQPSPTGGRLREALYYTAFAPWRRGRGRPSLILGVAVAAGTRIRLLRRRLVRSALRERTATKYPTSLPLVVATANPRLWYDASITRGRWASVWEFGIVTGSSAAAGYGSCNIITSTAAFATLNGDPGSLADQRLHRAGHPSIPL